MFFISHFFFGGGGPKNPKIVFLPFHNISNNFDFLKLSQGGGGSGEIEIKASLIPAELELGLSLAKINKIITIHWYCSCIAYSDCCIVSVLAFVEKCPYCSTVILTLSMLTIRLVYVANRMYGAGKKQSNFCTIISFSDINSLKEN